MITDEYFDSKYDRKIPGYKEKMKEALLSEQFAFFMQGMERNIFEDSTDFSNKLYKKFNSSKDVDVNALVYNLTIGEPIHVIYNEDGLYIVDNGFTRFSLAKELNIPYLYGYISK